MKRAYFPFFLLLTSVAMASSARSGLDELMEEVTTCTINVDLKNPTYSDGVLKTTEGGVVTTPNLALQGKEIRYTKSQVDGQSIATLHAEGALLMEFKDYIFVGDKLEYDFVTQTGVIENGRTAIEPWFIGGARIEIQGDGSYIIYNGYLTTSESTEADWQVSFEKTTLDKDRNVAASHIRFRFYDVPALRFKGIKANLNNITDMPLRLYAALDGRYGPRFTLFYELYTSECCKNFLRLDYRLRRGPGIGLETHYRSKDSKERLETVSYVARDNCTESPHEKVRYRLQGEYSNLLHDDKISLSLSYDKLSDQEMASDYSYSSIDLKYTGMTRLQARWQEDRWIANFLTTVRVNDFQTLKQELPSWGVNWKPFEIGSSGIISDNRLKASYLDFQYAKEVYWYKYPSKSSRDSQTAEGGAADIPPEDPAKQAVKKRLKDYHSIRLEYFQRFYRRFFLGNINVVPEAALLSIYYENPRRGSHRWLNMGLFTLEGTLPIYRTYSALKHTLIPYVRYNYYTAPTLSPQEHYIFDIHDGWYRLNMLQLGTRHIFNFNRPRTACWDQYATLDLHMNAFCDTPTQPVPIPKLYAKSVWALNPYVRSSIDTAWDFQFHCLDHLNFRTDWTVSQNFAIALELRHRSAFSWRKSDVDNFLLEAYRTAKNLEHSPLSDRRDTLLLRFFYRFTPQWASEFQIRHGWHRKKEPNYTEFEWDLVGTIQRAWHLRFSYQHKENDPHRFAVYLNFGLRRPVQSSKEHHIPTLSF